MKPGDESFFKEVRHQARRLVAILGIRPIIFSPMSATLCRKYFGLAFMDENVIGLSIRNRHKRRWGKPHLAYQITDTICHEIAHMKLNGPLHDTKFLNLHAKYLALAAKHGIHRGVEKAVDRARRAD